MRFRFIEAEKANHAVKTLCRLLQVSRSGFYAWCERPLSRREQQNRTALVHVRAMFREHKRRYGSPRVCKELRLSGFAIGRHRTARLMQADGLRAVGKRRFRATTNSNHSLPIAPNVVNRCFEATRTNQIWLTDITYIWTQQGWMYLSCMLDIYSRAIISHELDETLDASVSCRVLRRAIAQRKPEKGLVHHSDRGIQYASIAYRSILESHSIVASMSRKGDCWDNAPMESFFATLKREIRADSYVWRTKEEARAAIDEYINYYNGRRLHSQLDYVSPVRYELALAA